MRANKVSCPDADMRILDAYCDGLFTASINVEPQLSAKFCRLTHGRRKLD
jgi:hypothetical protein